MEPVHGFPRSPIKYFLHVDVQILIDGPFPFYITSHFKIKIKIKIRNPLLYHLSSFAYPFLLLPWPAESPSRLGLRLGLGLGLDLERFHELCELTVPNPHQSLITAPVRLTGLSD